MTSLRRRRPAQANARHLAFWALYHCLEEGRTAKEAFHLATERLAVQASTPPFYRRARQLFYRCLEVLPQLDAMLRQQAGRSLAKIETGARLGLRLAQTECFFSSQPQMGPAIHAWVDLIRYYGHEGLARFSNAIMRGLLRRGIRGAEDYEDWARAYQLQYPEQAAAYRRIWEGLSQRAAAWGQEGLLGSFADFLQAAQQPRKMELHLGPEVWDHLPPSEQDLLQPAPWPPGLCQVSQLPDGLEGLSCWREGQAWVQGAAAQAACWLLPLPEKSGVKVWDCCAAPGGKTLLLHERLQAQEAAGRIWASDAEERRLGRLTENLCRLGLAAEGQIQTCKGRAQDLAPQLAPEMDLVYCDVPCSSSGLFGSEKELPYLFRPASQDLLNAQQEIVQACAAHLRPGACLCYSSCSWDGRENEEQIEAFLASSSGSDYELLPAPEPPEGGWPPGVLIRPQKAMYYFLPPHYAGFFLACLRRKA